MAYFGQNVGNGASIDPQVAPISPLQLAQTGYYNSLSGINRQNMPIQAQDAANRNALSQQAIQTGQMALDEKQQQQTDAAIIKQQAAGASSWAPAQSNTTTQQAPSTAATAPQGAPITSAGPVRAQTPQVQAPGLSSLLTNPNALTANQSQVMQWQNPSSAQTNPGAQNAPILPPPPLKAYPLIGAPGANDPAILNHPELQAVTGAHNNQDTSGAVGSNPTFNAVQTYDAKGPDGQSGQFTLSRAKIISNLMDPNRPSAGPGDPGGARPDLANGLVKQWTDGDLQSEKAKQSALVVQHATLAGKIAAFEALPDYMKPDAYGSLMQETQQEGIKTAGILPDTYDPSDKTGMAQIKNFESQASTVAEREKAQLDKINSQINQQKADSEVKLQGAQASEIPSKIGLNNANSAKAYADAAKAKQDVVMGANGGTLPVGTTAQNYADAMIQGRSSWPTGRELMDPTKKAGLALAMRQDPTLNQNTFPLRQKAYTDSVNGKGGNTLSSVDTAILHLGNYVKNTPDIPDTGSKILNSVYQPFREATSNSASDAIHKAATDQTTLADELESAYRNGGGTEKGIEYFRNMLNPRLPESTRIGNAQEMTELVMGKRGETVNRINRSFPQGKGLSLPMDPEASAALSFIRSGGKGTPGAAPGQAQTAPQGPAGANHPAASQMQDGTVSASGKFIWHGGWVAR
jgi:hypothetical protein